MPVRKTRRADGRYQESVYVDSPDGNRIRKVFYGKTQKEALKLKKEFIEANGTNHSSRITLQEWADKWLETYSRGGYTHQLCNRSICDVFVRFIGKRRRLSDIKPIDVQSYANEAKKYSKSHVDKIRRNLTNMFKAAVDNKFIQSSPCEGILWDYVRNGSHEAIPSEIVELITNNWQVHSAGTWAMLMMYAGLRTSEAFALDRSNITEDKIIVCDGSHFEHGQLVIMPGKLKTDAGYREIPILPPLRPVIASMPSSGLVCRTTKGMSVSQSAYKRNWTAFCNALEGILNNSQTRSGRRTDRLDATWKKLPHIETYDLRHTFCSMLYDMDVDVKTAQYLMGHSNIDMTLKIYTHLSEKKKTRSYDKMFAYFESKKNGSQDGSQKS